MSALLLHWLDSVANFGDQMSRDVVSHLSDRPVEWGDGDVCDLFAIGSIMMYAGHWAGKTRNADNPMHVWGTGMLSPLRCAKHMTVLKSDSVVYHALRGPLTGAMLDNPTRVYGDPGLLVPQIVPQAQSTGKIGIIPHHSVTLAADVLDEIERDDDLQLIDVGDGPALDVAARICACDRVISASLHGLIVADAYGIPSAWWMPRQIHQTAEFKFYDYALAIERPMPDPLRDQSIGFWHKAQFSNPNTYAQMIKNRTDDLVQAFPDHLRAEPINHT